MNKLVTVITVVYNDVNHIEQTIKSVLEQTYQNVEYIIVDGNSNDGTSNIVNRYVDSISLYLREPDNGIYDAMNKGIKNAKGNWLIFMNSGDTFSNNEVLSLIFNNYISDDVKVLYSDFYLKKNNKTKLLHTSHENGQLLHQSIVYKKELHKKHGLYQVTNPIIISDYLFFSRIPKSYFKKVDVVISIYDAYGISSQAWCTEQKLCIDFVYNKYSIGVLLIKIFSFKIKQFIKFLIGL